MRFRFVSFVVVAVAVGALHAPAAAQDTAGVADQWATLASTHRDLAAGWRPDPGTLLVVDHAADAPPEAIADLAEAAAKALLAGIDVDMKSGAYDEHLAALVIVGARAARRGRGGSPACVAGQVPPWPLRS